MSRSILLLLVLGIALRCIGFLFPVTGFRETQTGEAIRYLSHHPYSLDSVASWRGDETAQIVQEFPIYNWMVDTLARVTHDIAIAGKIVSISFWALSFILLQALWRRFLDKRQTLWANLLFVFAPLNLYFGQALMPEMLLQAVSIGFILAVLEYADSKRTFSLIAATVLGALGMVVKGPAFLHLSLLACGWLFYKLRGALLRRPAHYLAGALAIVAILAWGQYITKINSVSFPEFTSRQNLIDFIGPLQIRFQPGYYVKLAAYNAFFLVTPIGMLLCALGLAATCRRETIPEVQKFMLSWWVALVLFWLLWSKAAPSQHYYNLSNLIPACWAFGIGLDLLWKWLEKIHSTAIKWGVFSVVTTLLIICSAVATVALFSVDRPILEASLRVKQRAADKDIILVKANHHSGTINYGLNTVVSFLAEHRTWVWTNSLSESQKERALKTSNWAVVTNPPKHLSTFEIVRRKFGSYDTIPENMAPILIAGGFAPVESTENYSIWRKN